jgi:hypothetical protein
MFTPGHHRMSGTHRASCHHMPERATIQRAKQKLRRGRSATSAAGEFVREEMHHIREGKHGARSTKQAIAIGLSKARRAGVPLRPPKKGSARTRRAAGRAYDVGQHRRKPRAPSSARGRAISRALRREPRRAASHRALATQAHRSAVQRGPRARAAAARKAVRTKGPRLRAAAARKAAATRKRRQRSGAAPRRNRRSRTAS